MLGADLGIPVDHDGTLYIFFGDTIGFAGIWGNESHPDSVGYGLDSAAAIAANPALLCSRLAIVSLAASASVGPTVDSSVLRDFADDIAALPVLEWVGYLSTVGVYGDAKGAWVDETSPIRPLTERSLRRAQAEQAWLDFGAGVGRRVEVFRLAGIYGPGRSVIDNLRAGTARRIVKPGQVFNRIHVDDIARVLAAAIDKETGLGIFNVSDDEPAAPEDVVACAAELLGLPIPPAVPFEEAGLSGTAASFWSECKRVKNARIRRDLRVELLYPTYREGLRALAVP